eukprot:1186344-Prorocentrum_minimum.AAC.2
MLASTVGNEANAMHVRQKYGYYLEEARRELGEPLGFDDAALAHVLLGGEDELVVDDPVRLPLEERRGRVDVHRLVLHHRLVALLGVLARRVEEKAAADGAPDAVEVLARAHAVQPAQGVATGGQEEGCVEIGVLRRGVSSVGAPGDLRRLVTAIVLGRGRSVTSRWAREYVTELSGRCNQPFSPGWHWACAARSASGRGGWFTSPVLTEKHQQFTDTWSTS